MKNRARTLASQTSRPLVALAALLVILAMLANPNHASAHAELVTSDPPIDGLVLDAPDHITLTFTEEVETANPAPAITLLDQDGTVIGDNPLPLAPAEDARTVTVTVPSVDPGTYTVSWTVTSATDAHTLTGTFAFRVGGGLPPGQATTEGESPAIWAVATRWITFLGASVATGMLLFSDVLATGPHSSVRWRRRRARLLLGGALVALIATIAEPVLEWLIERSGEGSLTDVLKSFPTGWWWRPAMLVPLAVLAVVIAYPLRGKIIRPVAWVGAVLALGSLLGLVMTSHAAGREDYRSLAIAFDALHQWSVALWCGGLVALALWAASRSGDDGTPALHMKRFSTLALGLFAIAVISGVVNAGFIFDFVQRISDDGWNTSAFEPLWTSNYGIVLLIKVLLLLIPFGLAVYHRSLVVKFGQQAVNLAATYAYRFRKTLRWELAAVALVILGGSTIALSSPPPPDVETPLDRITLVSSTTPDPEPGSLLVHLTVDPARTGENALTARLTDWDGNPVPASPAPGVTLDFTSLDHGTTNEGVNLQPTTDGQATYQTSGLNLSLDGWWRIDARIVSEGVDDQVATFYTLLPDPNTQGFDAPPKPETDPEAEALFNTAQTRMETWQRVRWTENLGSGSDVMVRAEFAVIDGGESGVSAYSQHVVYSGGFAPLASGSPPSAPRYDSRTSITVGDQAWLRTTDGDWLEEPPTNFAAPSEWGDIYTGATNFRMGITQEINGQDLQVITFHLPEQASQSEAWFAWWIDPDTGDVVQIAMIARQHYMVWSYTDINGDVTITPPN